MPVCVGARVGGGGGGAGPGGGGASGHTTGRCPVLLYHSRLDCPGCWCWWPLALPSFWQLPAGRQGGGGGMSGHTMVRCLALPLLARPGGVGRSRLSLTQPVPHLGTSRQTQYWVSDTSPLRAVVAQSLVMGYAGPYLEPYGSDRHCSQRDRWV